MPAAFIGIGAAIGFSGTAALVVGVAASAVVGAAIGGLVAAVSGGDIGKGMLFGAIGGVATVGIAGAFGAGGAGGTLGTNVGSVSATAAEGLGTYTTAAGQTMAALGEGGGVALVEGAATSGIGSTVAKTGASSLFGGVFDGTGGQLVAAAGQLFAGEEETPYSQSQEYLDKQLAAQTEVGLAKAGGSGHAPNYTREVAAMNNESAEKRLQEELQGQYKLQGMNADSALKQQEQEYKLANENAASEWQRGLDKLTSAGDAAASVGYESGSGNFDAIAAAEAARKGGALQGPAEEPNG